MSIFLVGAGPGDPGLISARGLQALRQADLVVYDAGAAALLAEARAEAALRLAPPGEAVPLLLAAAAGGQTACRLLAGDPYCLGAAAAEAAALQAAGVACRLIPGVPAALAAAAAAGVLPGEATRVLPVAAGGLPALAAALRAAGQSPATPAVFAGEGGAVVCGTLAELAARPLPAGWLCLGAALHPGLAARRPLAGCGVLVTRARAQAGPMLEQIAALGGTAWLFPAIRTVPPADWAALDRALAALGEYAWLVVTSANAVESFAARLWQTGGDARRLAQTRIAAVGAATARALQAAGLRADLLPPAARAAALPAAMAPYLRPGDRVLIPRADLADPGLRQGLEALGCRVDDPIAYRTVPDDADPAPLRAALAAGRIHYATFTSGSTVRHTLAAIGGAAALAGVRIAVLGPETAKEAAALGLTVHLQAAGASVQALVEAIAADAERSRQA